MRWLCQVYEPSPCYHCTSAVATGANSTSEHPFSCQTMMALNSSSLCAPLRKWAPFLWFQLKCLNLWSLHVFTQTRVHWRTIGDDYGATCILCFRRNVWKGVALQQTPHKFFIQKQTETFWAPCRAASNICESSRHHAPPPWLVEKRCKCVCGFQPFSSYIYISQTGFGDPKCALCMILVWMSRTFRKNNWKLSFMLPAE